MTVQKKIAPSILSADFAYLGREVRLLEEAGADWLHIDVMDGVFVPNLTIGAPVVRSLKNITPLPLDVHLMVTQPERLIDLFVKAGSDLLTVHVEAFESTSTAYDCLKKIRKAGLRAGMSLKPNSNPEKLDPYWDLLDLVLVMAVEPGFGGQDFLEDMVSKISVIRKKIKELNREILVSVDGGINQKTAPLCYEVDVLVSGNYIFSQQQKEYKKAIEILRN